MHVCTRKLKKRSKNKFFKFFTLITFFRNKRFFTRWGVSGSGKPSGSGKFFYFYCFFGVFELENLIQTWKLQFSQKFRFDHFSIFEHVSDLNPGLCSFSGSKNLTQHRSKIVLKCILRIFWDSENFVVKRSLKHQKLYIYVEPSKWAEGHQKRNV